MLRRFCYFFLISPPTFTFAGYLANWKIFAPRKLMPLSIDDCSAPIAVITKITEKTPMVMPIMVRPARSLFAPSEASAIFMISLNNILVHHRGHGEHRVTEKLLRAGRELSGECLARVCAR